MLAAPSLSLCLCLSLFPSCSLCLCVCQQCSSRSYRAEANPNALQKTQLTGHMCKDHPKKVKNFLERVKASKYGHKRCQDINKQGLTGIAVSLHQVPPTYRVRPPQPQSPLTAASYFEIINIIHPHGKKKKTKQKGK